LSRSASITSAISGYCTLTTTGLPSASVARWTCPIEAAANASGSISRKSWRQPGSAASS